jgi:hypothetical protein
LPPIRALVDGRGNEVSVPTRDLHAANRLLDDLVGHAGPEFALALEDLRSLIMEFEGRTIAEGWSEIAER